ncbi:LuxR C-terminal-related transcriptional regulator [Kitasatospora sp. NBC_01250]|uniref:LuxR C-terminal-related transcriptional regulator n=1 Tax=Kitasatospora sp. NBC_01250 TaxID=2903571 RepID=UPI002E3128C0|nr:LuxR C-terminal-related transcriptional regulator [Kitasatospora sp. NBC_01250]
MPARPVGDAAELVAAVRSLLAADAGGGVVLHGPPGVGKSWLAQAVAADWRRTGGLVVVAATRGPVTESSALLRHRADPLSPPGAEQLVLLDGIDALDPELGRAALAAARTGGVRVLATARRRAAAPGLTGCPVAPLAVPADCSGVALQEFCQVPSVQLYASHVRELNPDFRIDRHNQHQIAQTCVDLRGVPGALVLAARVAGLEGPEVLTAILERRAGPEGPELVRLLNAYRRGRPSGPVPQLTAAGRRLLAHAVLFTGGFGAEALRQVTGVPVEEFTVALQTLVDAQLLALSGLPSGRLSGLTRVRLHLPLDVPAQPPPDPREPGFDRPAARLAHARYYARLARAGARRIEEGAQQSGLAALHCEERNIRTALDTLLGAGPAGEALDLIEDTRGYADATGIELATAGQLRALAAACPPGEQDRLALLLAEACLQAGEADGLQALLDQAVATGAPTGPHGARWQRLCAVREFWHDTAAGSALLERAAEQALQCARRDGAAGGAERGAARIRLEAALARFLSGDSAGAVEAVRRALPDALRRQDVVGAGGALLHLSLFLAATGDSAAAQDCHQRAMANLRTLGAPAVLGAFLTIAASPLLSAAEVRARGAVRVLAGFHAGREACLGTPTEPDLAVSRIERRYRPMLSEREFDEAQRAGAAVPLPLLLAELAVQYRRTADRPAPAAHPAIAVQGQKAAGSDVLTLRQHQVALLVADGLGNRQIARQLLISEWTVVNHMREIMKRLGCGSRAQVARWVHTGEPSGPAARADPPLWPATSAR